MLRFLIACAACATVVGACRPRRASAPERIAPLPIRPITAPRADSATPLAPILAPAYARAADSLARRDAAADARVALRGGDVALLALDAHYGVHIPGVPDSHVERLKAACGYRLIPEPGVPYGEPDGKFGRELRTYQSQANDYAARYNRTLLADRGAAHVARGCHLTLR